MMSWKGLFVVVLAFNCSSLARAASCEQLAKQSGRKISALWGRYQLGCGQATAAANPDLHMQVINEDIYLNENVLPPGECPILADGSVAVRYYHYGQIQCGLGEPSGKPHDPSIARDSDGKILQMTQPEAIAYCAGKGMHLPTVREWSAEAVALGAKVSETKVDSSYFPMPDAMSLYEVRPECYSKPEFFMNVFNYRSPETDFSENDFWTSTTENDIQDQCGVHFEDPNPYHGHTYYGGNGLTQTAYPFDRYPVRCVKNQ
jgi:hypothetical protein